MTALVDTPTHRIALCQRSAATPAGSPSRDVSVEELVQNLSESLQGAIGEIHDVNADTRLLSLNARIEAARAGSAGAAFGVVAQEIQSLSAKTADAADRLATDTQATINELLELIGARIRGTRLSDCALVNIDLIDRNLYERTCDVRWWATDSSVAEALTQRTPEACEFASRRLGVILSAYTVYFDLVLCDLSGRVVANGRPDLYRSVGSDQSHAEWFRAAVSSRSGDEFGFQTAHRSPLVVNQPALIYSCGVRAEGKSAGRLLGALGVVFNWEGLAQTVLQRTPLSVEEQSSTRCVIADSAGRLLADSWGRHLDESLELPRWSEIIAAPKNFLVADVSGRRTCVAHALAPGFETYSTGWHSLILQTLSG